MRLFFAVFIGKRDGHALRVLFNALHFAARLYLNVFLAEGFIKFRGNFFVFHRHHARQGFENRHLRAKGVVNGRKFYAHCSRSHYNQRLWNCR